MARPGTVGGRVHDAGRRDPLSNRCSNTSYSSPTLGQRVKPFPRPVNLGRCPPTERRPRHRRLAELGVDGQVRTLDDAARTAAQAAAQLGIEVAQIANSLVFAADGTPLLVMASGGHRVDTAKVAALVGARSVDRADPDFVRAHTGFAIGGVAPVGPPGAAAHPRRHRARALRRGLGCGGPSAHGLPHDVRRAAPDHRRTAADVGALTAGCHPTVRPGVFLGGTVDRRARGQEAGHARRWQRRCRVRPVRRADCGGHPAPARAADR